MGLFNQTCNKTKLQKELDGDAACCKCQAPSEPVHGEKQDENKPLFQSEKKSDFHVDLMGGWGKP